MPIIYLKLEGTQQQDGFLAVNTLQQVADHFGHGHGMTAVRLQVATGEFAVAPMTTALSQLHDFNLSGNGSSDEPFIMRIDRAGASGLAPGITPAVLLGTPLLEVKELAVVSSASTHPRQLKPDKVRLWEDVEPSDPEGQGSLLEAISQHQRDADGIYGTKRLHNPRTVDIRSIDSEVALASRWDSAVAAPLTDLACILHPDDQLEWTQQPPRAIIHDALSFTHQDFRAQPLSAPPHTLRSGRLSRAPQVEDTASQPSGSSRCKMDFVLMRPEPSAPPHKRRCICVGKVKRAQVLVDSGMPVDLVDAWRNPQDALHTRACAVISNLFTYMQLWKICYGFITCWFGTWLAYCPPDDRCTLYISQPFLSSQAHPKPTSRGAVAWLQEAAWQHMSDAVHTHPDLMDSPVTTGGQGTSNARGDNFDDTSQFRDAGAESGSNEEYNASHSGLSSPCGQECGGQKCGGQKCGVLRKQAAPSAPVVHLGHKLCEGSEGAVLEGTCQGQPAVIKLLGPDESGLAAFQCEEAAYRALSLAQGVVVPRLLAACHWVVGVHAIVTARIAGTPLSRLERIPDAVAQAALHALEHVHAFCPDLCHGDVRLHNILLVQQKEEGAGAACMVIDFGRARRGCSRQQQQDEVQQLASLLKSRKPSS